MTQRLEYFRKHGVERSSRFMNTYFELLNLCIEDWWCNPKKLEFFEESNVEVFRKIIKGSAHYLNRNDFLNNIKEEKLVIQPPQRIVSFDGFDFITDDDEI